jgi:hypothetical protein
LVIDCFLFCGPAGPSTPFATPVLSLLDLARVACLLCAAVVIVALGPRAMARATTPGQKARFLSQLLLVLVAAGTELEHLGDYASSRLLFNLVALTLAVYGFTRYFRYELPAKDRDRIEP